MKWDHSGGDTHPSIPRPPQFLRGVSVKKTVLSVRMTRIDIDRWIHLPFRCPFGRGEGTLTFSFSATRSASG